jgi:hypothetical protein
MHPEVLEVGRLCRISFLYAPTVRMQLKAALVSAYSPTFTAEVYRVADRRLAPGSRRVVLYDLGCIDDGLTEGQQAPTRINNLLVRIPLEVVDCDRRWLMPLSDEHSTTPTLARRYPDAAYAFSLFQ